MLAAVAVRAPLTRLLHARPARAAGGTCRFTYGAPGMVVSTALGSLEIEDLLVGQRCVQKQFLASSMAGERPNVMSSMPHHPSGRGEALFYTHTTTLCPAPCAPGVVQVGDELFFDADDAMVGSGSGTLTPRSSTRSSFRWVGAHHMRAPRHVPDARTDRAAALPCCAVWFTEQHARPLAPRCSLGSPRRSSGEQGAKRDLAEFTFKLLRPGTSQYEGVDTSLDINLRYAWRAGEAELALCRARWQLAVCVPRPCIHPAASSGLTRAVTLPWATLPPPPSAPSSLYFYCNRPTVAALISLGLDMGSAASMAFGSAGDAAGAGDEGGDGDGAACATETGPGAVALAGAVEQGAAEALGAEPAAELQLLGGDDRSTFRMRVTLATLQVVLNYEGSDCRVLSQVCCARAGREGGWVCACAPVPVDTTGC